MLKKTKFMRLLIDKALNKLISVKSNECYSK